MASIELTAIEIAVHEQSGTAMLLEARDLVSSNRVSVVRRDDDPTTVLGTVHTDQGEFTAWVRLSPERPGNPDVRQCSCGKRKYCVHVAALVLSTEARTRPKLPTAPEPSLWEAALTQVLKPATKASEVSPAPQNAQIALQFELRADAEPAAIDVRLVIPGTNGGWVRSTASWTWLNYTDHHLRRVPREHVRLLKEFAGLATGYAPHINDRHFTLTSITSSRIWPVLQEMKASGLPLVMSGRTAMPVRVLAEPLTPRIALRRSSAGIHMEAVLAGDGTDVEAPFLPIADPAHGVAWHPDHSSDQLSLAALAVTPPEVFRRLAHNGFPVIPAAGEERFLTEFFPRLAEQIEVVSPDGSVETPQPLPPVIEFTITVIGEHRVRLESSWIYRLGKASRREPVRLPYGKTPAKRNVAGESAVLEQLRPILGEVPGLLEPTTRGLAPVPSCTVEGMGTAHLLSQVVPALRDRDDVLITLVTGESELPEYHESHDAPVFSFAPSKADGGDSQDWFDLAVTITVDGRKIPFQELFLALAQGEMHLLLEDGLWFSLDRDEFHRLAALIAESREIMDAPEGSVRIGRFHSGIWSEIDDLGEIKGRAAGWRKSVQTLSQLADLPEHKLPAGVEASLRSYQEDGFRWLATLLQHRLGGVLADDMGLGKTLQTLTLLQHAQERKISHLPFLVVAPTSVIGNWAHEAQQFTPDLRVAVLDATSSRRGYELSETIEQVDVVVTSYTLFRLEFADYRKFEWAGLILDEAQTVKNHQSAGYRCARDLSAEFKLAVTGTPIENNLMELWALFSITAPGLFPRAERFTDYYRKPIEREQNPERLAQLRRRIGPLMLRRNKEQVASDLPERREQVIELDLAPKQRTIYQKYLQRERQRVLGLLGDLTRNRFEIFRSLTLLRQASLDVSLIDPVHANVPSTKLDALLEHLAEIAAQGHRVLVFSQFTRFLTRAAQRLDEAGLEYCYLDGKTRKRAEVISRFREGDAPVFLISLKAGGTGLTLTEADYVFLLDPWWNPAVEAQAVDRAHRIGQTRNVMVYRLVAKDTIEAKVMALKARKSALTNSVLEGDEIGSAALTADDIRGLLD
ncbi:DEAD/DEAH box helicase [Kineosporia babensis]|uniref:DEAD/DEAH box helicase n=1 Tax=Kineosporia babensis TaxID=499548 RepID=A0A9X1T0P7_9ACTN|nr:DEAD/DEAH box helicase [Kineosporia babensis]MCD5313003.1 DEAD/DEAH box helicase [Kineosporia babensis]